MRLPYKTLEKKLLNSGYARVVGIDEVGMGCLAGPVVVCAVLFNKKFFAKPHKKLHWLRDSKLLSPRRREEFVLRLLQENNFKYRLAHCRPKTIDRINIYQAARKAMRRAAHKLARINDSSPLNSKRTIILVDGKNKIAGVNLPQMAIVRGDRKIFAIACASLIAKVARDRMMRNYSKKYPGYGFEKHKGYGTKLHQAQLAALGPCRLHRKSFAPVAKML